MAADSAQATTAAADEAMAVPTLVTDASNDEVVSSDETHSSTGEQGYNVERAPLERRWKRKQAKHQRVKVLLANRRSVRAAADKRQRPHAEQRAICEANAEAAMLKLEQRRRQR